MFKDGFRKWECWIFIAALYRQEIENPTEKLKLVYIELRSN